MEIRFPAGILVVVASVLLAACGATLPTRPDTAPLAACPAPASAPVVSEAVVPPPRPMRPPRVALALGGGAARGFAHIGVIEVLEENGIHPDIVTGTSAGSLVAALYASGRTGKELENIAIGMDESALTDWSFPGRGLIRGEALAHYVREATGNKPLEQMKIPLGIVATDLDSGKPILFRRGDVGTAVRASSAVPAVFQPVKLGTHEYVDGGLTSPVPVRAARDMGADVIIAVDISQLPDGGDTSNALHMLLQTFSIMSRSINELELKEAEIALHPRLVGVAGTDFTVRKKNIEAGREAALAMLPQIKAKVAMQVPVVR
ncbi:patatin-like phospholipase family protein [Scleromatobacter humisilvae]|uniref:Patatin-like phospholipase family protein n=1 Tax=Scleromatobacter humisilvae TaxID=2897159 RepID=A0A9X1YJU1_9BURK|nr:patatin-like phospholipase family protein [Scleromatobacter humisilvae]MCK9687221.1 patatin-like phospholipase family protein [Scleromatobacter humisilvae]